MEKFLQELEWFVSVRSIDARLEPSPDFKSRQAILRSSSNSKLSNMNADGGIVKGKYGLATRPALWHTWEFRFYYLAFIVVVPLMFRAAYTASSESNPNYYKFAGYLSDGWIFGRKVDNSDPQYKFFRDNMPLLVGLMLMHTMIKKISCYGFGIDKLKFDFVFGFIFLFLCHGVNSLRVLAHLIIMFSIAHIFKRNRRFAVASSWAYGIASLFINDKYRNYPFGGIAKILAPLDNAYKGIIPRWDVFFNFTLLRMISYNMDFLERWSNRVQNTQPASAMEDDVRPDLKKRSSTPTLETIHESGKNSILDERSRLIAPHHIQDYNFANYIAYIAYTPLLIAGPILTFNDYLYQSRNTLPSINKRQIVSYAIKLAVSILTMELVLHYSYVVAISKTKAWTGDTPFQVSMIGLFNLNIIWLKLLIPWRLFRLWAFIDEIDAPENMVRCVDNNYSALAFWRAWHRSYNKWIVRYIYIPLGGSRSRTLTSLAVFSFVAIWHDIQLKLLLWGWLVVLFLLPEMAATQYFARYRNKSWYRHLCAFGAVINISLMMLANLYGFCLGSDGTKSFLSEMLGTSSGLQFVGLASCALFIAVQVMFEIREHEKRQGINLKC
ncbi:hypothetical protein HG535_0H04030 [Zygotorulaspora mrakii]|uniref:Glycerol uptake protein 1 n=1 Tax=Zygotorulaspora mrakii TaxID=42260 RepID=A0A7H9B9M0_ZYGMR|nr:uncharacterized protein HG535_0H04030 [Zygotorulaspora mrakii]QLG75076.1 hypothetical protein HG535_0H04030 [Zygotorulaspora mrakii]